MDYLKWDSNFWYSIEWVQLVTTFQYSLVAALLSLGQTAPTENPLCRLGYQMGSNVGGRCSGTFYSGSDSRLSYSPLPWISQSDEKQEIFDFNKFLIPTSSAIFGPLLTKSPCLVTETTVLAVSSVTASSLSVLRNMM